MTADADPNQHRRVDSSVAVFWTDPVMRKRAIRALRASGMDVTLCKDAADVAGDRHYDLFVIDCDSGQSPEIIEQLSSSLGTVLVMSARPEASTLASVLDRHEVGHLIARHSGGRPAEEQTENAPFDEHELRVTCEKVRGSDIFGLEKYLASWGVVFHRATIRSAADKYRLLEEFEAYLRGLECPPSVVPDMVTVADELVTNAMVHGPRAADGSEKYAAGPKAAQQLEPGEDVDVTYASDGKRIGIAVGDNFGTLSRHTVKSYLKRALDAQMVPETKPSGAGLGIALSLRCNHQLIFNIHEGRRTEVIAGWDLGAKNANEFRKVAKSLGVFWLPRSQVPT